MGNQICPSRDSLQPLDSLHLWKEGVAQCTSFDKGYDTLIHVGVAIPAPSSFSYFLDNGDLVAGIGLVPITTTKGEGKKWV